MSCNVRRHSERFAHCVHGRLLLTGVVSAAVALGCASSGNDTPSCEPKRELPGSFGSSGNGDGPTAEAQHYWNTFFSDPHLQALIDAALEHNQELNIRLQEIIIANAEVSAAQGEYMPRVEARAGAGIEKVGEHTPQGVSDRAHGVPEHLPNFQFGLRASWEVDVWGRMRAAKDAANYRYLASIEARNFLITEIVAEIAESYWELVALDRRLEILKENIELQQSALQLVAAKKAAGDGTELEVRRFESEVLKNQGFVYELERQRTLVENRINFLVGRLPQKVARSDQMFDAPVPGAVNAGIPSELLDNRPDVREAANLLEAAKLDVKAAKARFYPSLSIDADVGYQSFNARHLIETPQSLAYNLMGNLVAPLVNRSAIAADYRAANARQVQAVYHYERTLLRAFTDVVNELATLDKLNERYQRLERQVEKLKSAIELSTLLYQSAHADYMEVLMTRRDALEAELELIETKEQQLRALVHLYKALGGGWRTKERE